MRWLLILSRLAFICNAFFLLAVSLQVLQWFRNEDAEATIIILGYVMVAVLNPLANLCYLFLLVLYPIKLRNIPRWLLFSNVVFLLLQITYIIYLNDR